MFIKDVFHSWQHFLFSLTVSEMDGKSAIITDNSSSSCKAGLSSSDAPSVSVPTFVGHPKHGVRRAASSAGQCETQHTAKRSVTWERRPWVREESWPWGVPSITASSPTGTAWRRWGCLHRKHLKQNKKHTEHESINSVNTQAQPHIPQIPEDQTKTAAGQQNTGCHQKLRSTDQMYFVWCKQDSGWWSAYDDGRHEKAPKLRPKPPSPSGGRVQ